MITKTGQNNNLPHLLLAIDMSGGEFPSGLVRETIISDCLLTEGWEDHLSEIMFSQCWKVYTCSHNLEEKIKIFFWQNTMFVPKKEAVKQFFFMHSRESLKTKLIFSSPDPFFSCE